MSILFQGRYLVRLTERILFKKDRFDRENQNLFFVIVHIKYLQAFKWCLLNDWKIHIIWNGSNPNWIIIINKYSVVLFNLTKISQKFIWREIYLMFSEQKRVKLIRSKWMTGTCYINNFIHGWYFPEFLFKLKLGSVMFSIFRLLFKCSFNGFSH